MNYHAVLAAPPTRITPPGPDGPDTAPRKPELRPNATDFAPDGAGTGSTNGTAATGTGTTTPAGHAPRTPVDPSVTPASRPRPTGPAFAEWPAELLLFRGTDDEVGDALVALDRRLGDGLALRGLTGAEGTGPTRVAIVAEDVAGLRAQIARALRFEDAPEHGVHVGDGARTPVALLFPGQGSQRPGMLADLFLHFPRLHRFLRADPALTAAMFPPGTFGGEPPRLVDTRLAQPALGVGGLAALDLLRACGVEPDLAGGHSYGELVALAAAGVLPADAVLPLSGARAAAMHTAAGTDAGAMAAVAAPADTVAALLTAQGLADDVVLANHNAPDQVVLAGSAAGIDTAVGALRAAGRTAKRLPVAAAFHSARMAPAAAAFADALAAQEFRTPRIPVWSGATARPYPAEQDAARALLAGAPARPVRFAEQIEEMYAAGARVFVEAGPGTVLTRLVGAVLGDRPHTALSVEAPGRPGLPHLLGTLAALAVRGADVRPDALTDDRTDAPVAPNAGWTVDGHLVRTADGTPVPGGLRPAEPPVVLAAGGGERDETVIEFLRGTQRIVAAQQEVVLRYLGGGSTGSAPVTTLPGAPVTAAAPGRPGNVHGSVPAEPAAAGGPGAGAGPAPSVLELVARRTGYPPAMLDPDLDLEAGLGVDSLKRTEMAATLLGDAADGASVGALSDLRTIREMTDWLAAHTADGTGIEGGDSGGSGGSGDAGDASDRGGRGDAGDVADGRSSSDGGRGAEAPRDGHPAARTPGIPAGEDARHDGTHPAAAPRRHLVELVPAPLGPPGPGQRRARRATVSGGGRTGAELTVLLKERGTEVVDDPTGCDTFLLLDALDPFVADEPVLPARFADVRTAVLAGARTLLLATCHDAGPAGAGLHGLARAVAREYPDLAVVAVDLPAGRPPAEAARLLADELDTCGPATDRSVGHLDGRRARWRTTPVALPAGDVTAADLGLDRDSVVLLTGGARGITARIATALAERTGCHVELLGRSAPAADASLDEAALRERLIAGGGRAPADIEREVRGYAAAREVRQCLDALAATAASVRHHRADVRDRDRLAAVLDDVYARHGRLDTVVHAAGVVHDRTLRDKTPQAFAEVFGTKVDGARALAAQLRPGVRHLVLFGSIAGVLGNRGQSDYAAANDALDTLARRWTGRVADRVLALDWGPWAAESGGMVTAGLERAYARQGIGLIDPDAGVAAFLRELAFGHDPQVLHAAGDLDAFGDGLG
ncbi:SDR family NAD(P)-dependent oxidoreductase [Streptomyces sp. NPDC004111]|uniref:SDR family NAD(P)-dependent oxidoreductase n=1 Tax=Streptomyces sp. NPDC004111 TaxID=3364690 RepID=UPI003685E447